MMIQNDNDSLNDDAEWQRSLNDDFEWFRHLNDDD